jgi:predicted PurR-regulated permease PerM
MVRTDTGNASIVKVIVGGAGLFIIIFGMKMSSSILSPILLALIIGISVAPLAAWLGRKGAPDWLALLITIALVILGIVGLIALVGISVSDLIATLRQYEDNLQELVDSLQAVLERVGLGNSQIHAFFGQTSPAKILSSVAPFFGGILGALSDLVIMLMVLIFFLLAIPGLKTKLRRGYAAGNPTVARIRGLAQDLREYVSITTWINFLVGLVNTVLLILLGVDYALLWGLLSFLMGYIPNVGFWIALVPPFLLALLQFGAARALIVLVGYILINGGVQNFLQPRMMGAGLNLSPLVVVLSLFFWGWVLGPMGALLAVPLTVIVKEVFLDAYDDTRDLAELMSADSPTKEPAPDVPAN